MISFAKAVATRSFFRDDDGWLLQPALPNIPRKQKPQIQEGMKPEMSEVAMYVGHLESKERLRIQPAQLFNFS